jgi:nucleotide-binding universal stress UspA family protein
MTEKNMEFRKILVPIFGTESHRETVELACRLLDKKNKGKIYAVYIIPVKRTLPLDADVSMEIHKAEKVLNEAEATANEFDCRLETDLLQAREIAPAIIEGANDKQADLILLGVAMQRRFGQFSLGNVVPYVLENAPCAVILYHKPQA